MKHSKQLLLIIFPHQMHFYQYHTRQYNVSHARMYMGCRELNVHSFRNNVINSTACTCGDTYEDVYHYLFVCPRYLVQQDKLITTFVKLQLPSLCWQRPITPTTTQPAASGITNIEYWRALLRESINVFLPTEPRKIIWDPNAVIPVLYYV